MRQSPRTAVQFAISGVMLASAGAAMAVVHLQKEADALEFGMGYGLGRFLGPWTLRRQDISEVRRVPTRFAAHDYVRIVRFAGAPWTFTTHEPGVLLACLEELGYPVARAAC